MEKVLMKSHKILAYIITSIFVAGILVTVEGITSSEGTGAYEYKTIRGEVIKIYGKGIYKDMSADIAIQGIAQDYVTLFLALPLLTVSFMLTRKNKVYGQIILNGVLLYIFLTYLFYTAMAMYNKFFLLYVFLLSASLFALLINLISFEYDVLYKKLHIHRIFKTAGIFLIVNAMMIAFLWLSVIVPPLINGKVYPEGLHHYTTMIVQGFDLGIFLPAAFISGVLVIKKNKFGFVFTPVYLVFLSVLMAALCSKIIFMANNGANVIPVIFIMPVICLLSVMMSVLTVKKFAQ